MDVHGDQRASLSSLSGDSASIMPRYRISKGRAADTRAKRFLEETFPHIGAGRLGCAHGCPGQGVDTLIFSDGFHEGFFDLVGAVGLGVGAQTQDRVVSPLIHFPVRTAAPLHKIIK